MSEPGADAPFKRERFERGDVVTLKDPRKGLGVVVLYENDERIHIRWIVPPPNNQWMFDDDAHRATGCHVWLSDYYLEKVGEVPVELLER